MLSEGYPSPDELVTMARQLKDEHLWCLYKLLQKLDKTEDGLYFLKVEKVVMQMVRKPLR